MKGRAVASLQISWPGGMVTDALPPNVTLTSVPFTTLPEYSCRPTDTAPNVNGALPKTLEKRKRIRLPHRSGLTMERKVWSTAWFWLEAGNGNTRSGWMVAGAKVSGGPGGAGTTGGA